MQSISPTGRPSMAHRYDHIREKAISLRTEQHLTLDEIVERLSLPRGTI